MRRPDMQIRHRCGSKWRVPELIAPSWRVIDTPVDDLRTESMPAAKPAVES